MIRYYAYYNFGGYKDFYLGCQQDTDDFKYYLPLLSIREQELQNSTDEGSWLEVNRQKQFPKLIVLSDNTVEYNYPTNMRILMSHAGYKLMYRQFDQDNFVLALRDIPGTSDAYGRSTPYSVMLWGNSIDDKHSLDIIAEYMRSNLSSVENFFNTILEYDQTENGLRCNIKSLNNEVQRICLLNLSFSVEEQIKKTVRMAIIPSGMNLSKMLSEQGLQKSDIAVCYDTNQHIIYKYSPQITHVNHLPNRPKSGLSNSTLSNDIDKISTLISERLREYQQNDIAELRTIIADLQQRITALENKYADNEKLE